MKVLLIGGTGVLSTDIVRQCSINGYDTYVLNRGNHSDLIPKGVKLLKGNIRDKEQIKSILPKIDFDIVVDFLSTDPKDLKSSYDFFESRCNQYIFISSACAFRRAPEDKILTEDSPKPNMNLPYSINKYECEKYLIKKGIKKSNCHYTIVRPYITYGDTRIPFGLAPLARYHWTIIGRILAGKPMFIWDNGRAVCTLTHTRDFSYNFVQLFNNERAFNEDFNLVGDYTYTWKEMLETLYGVLNVKPNYISIPSETIAKELPQFKDSLIGDRALNAKFDNSKLKNAIDDYQQHISLEKGIETTVNYYKTHNFLSGIDYVYDANIDRLIERVSKHKLSFVDYLNTSSKQDRILYCTYKHLSFKYANILSRVLHKLKI